MIIYVGLNYVQVAATFKRGKKKGDLIEWSNVPKVGRPLDRQLLISNILVFLWFIDCSENTRIQIS